MLLTLNDGDLGVPCGFGTDVSLVVQVYWFVEDDGANVHALELWVPIRVGPIWDDEHDFHLLFFDFI